MTDADAFIRSLPQPIAVVGNGTILNCGATINTYRTVVRFNNFADTGHEQDVGHRLDVWCVTCCGDVPFRSWAKMPKVMTIATVAEQPVDVPRWVDRYPDMAVPAESWINEARGFKGANPTTGLTLLLRMMLHKLDFTGFGFDGGRSGHYWDKLHQHWPSHGDEFAAILRLAKMGTVFL